MLTIVQQLRINKQRFQDDFKELAEIGATLSGGITRLALSNEDLEARAWFADKVEEAGLFLRDDEVGNLSGILRSHNPSAKTFLLGSHLDTVQNGGQYDGSIGVLAALEILRTIQESGLELPMHLEAINFTDEEGTWKSFFGSLGIVGGLKATDFNDALEDNGAFRAALFRAGIRSHEVQRAARNADDLAGYLELHIEQAEKLEQAGKQIGIVTGIVGRSAYNMTFYGEATHAATTPPEKQRDALQGAAVFITEMHQLVRETYPEGIANCGNVRVLPGTFNVIPSEASLRVEVRHPDESKLEELESRVLRLAQDCARNYRLTVSIKTILRRPAVQMDADFLRTIQAVCEEQNRSFMHLRSYPGHDAQMLNRLIPTAMIFIPSQAGISHNPKEYSSWDDIEAGANVMLHTLLRLVGEAGS